MPSAPLSGRPILGNRLDRDLFTGRQDEHRRVRRAMDDGLNCVVTAETGMGRTSLLSMVLADLRADGVPALMVQGRTVDHPAGLLSELIGRLDGSDAPPVAPGRRTRELGVLIAELRDAATGADHPVIAVDDVPAEAGFELFGLFRDELWTVPARWLATISSSRAAELLRPPADVFFDVRVDLAPLTEQESLDLLRRRTDRAGRTAGSARDAGWRRAAEVAGGSPRRLIELAREQHGDAAGPGASDRLARREAALAQLSAPARMLARELEAVGGAAASDPQLLERLGWTRARAVQVLKQLEAAGVVTADDVRSGPGRPRRVYRLR